MRPGAGPLRFRSLRTRLAVLYAGLFAGAMMVIAVVAQVIVDHNARASATAALSASAAVYDRLWALRERSLAEAAGVGAQDFGFRSAVASGDRPTIASALVSLRRRTGATEAMVVDLDGGVVGARGPLAERAAALPFEGSGTARGVLVVDGATYQAITVPILAPNEIGWVVIAVRLDAAEMHALERLSSIPLPASIVHREPGGGWARADGTPAALPPRLGAARTFTDDAGFVAATPLAAASGGGQAALLLRYPYAHAYAPYRPLQFGIALTALLGLVLVVAGSRWLARGIVRPIAQLDAAARALEEGARAQVAVTGEDEIGRLASSFNRMSAGIAEREDRIAHLAFHDALTGLPNRVALRQTLDVAIGRAAHDRDRLCLLSIDLDGFKGVNDTLGHPVGDALLRRFAEMLRAMAPEAFVARLAGDEFAVLLPAGFRGDRPRALAQQLVDRLAEPVVVDGHAVATGAGIGIALFPEDASAAEPLIKAAGFALSQAKAEGRGQVHFFEPGLDAAARRRRQIELDLRVALREGQFALHFQPIVDIDGGRVRCVEALLRWTHPERGPVSPAEFIPVAEDAGLIVAIGEWVLHEACRVVAGWPGDVRVAVNVSTLQFRHPGFEAVVLRALARTGLAPRRLEVEITESVFLDGQDPVVTVLHRLRTMGVRVALDDFGTGYSSLSYLRSFPFDKIKIDRSFVTGIATDRGAEAIVRAIIDLARALGMDTTAEGVEDAAQAECLRAQGCDTIQGYLYSRPLDAAAAAAFLSDAARRSA